MAALETLPSAPAATTPVDPSPVIDIIFGRWKSQILHAGVTLGVFDTLSLDVPADPYDVAARLDVDADLLYRLMRALASLELLRELPGRRFVLTPQGALLTKDHPATLRGMTLLEEGPTHYALWTHLPAMIRDGRQNAFLRQFGRMAFDHAAHDPEYGAVFNEAMTSYSRAHTAAVLDALDGFDFAGVHDVCDIGGGFGHLLASLLAAHPHLRGTILDLPQVVVHAEHHWAPRLGVADRCTYAAGDMFAAVPSADVYVMKLILHDWDDDECAQILANAAAAARPGARLLIVEHVVPGAAEPHFAKLFDIHMMCWGTGRERTVGEYAALGERAGWEYTRLRPSAAPISVVELRLAR